MNNWIRKSIGSVLVAAAVGVGAAGVMDHHQGEAFPSGVTLVQPDGGTNYYSQWSGSWATTWNDPNFLPIATFGQFDLGKTQPNGMTRIAGVKDAGVNTFIALANTLNGDSGGGGLTDGQQIVNNSMWAIDLAVQANVTSTGLTSTVKNRVAGWMYGDEMDGHSCSDTDVATYHWIDNGTNCTNCNTDYMCSSFLVNRSNNLRAYDTTRMTSMGYNHNWAFHLWEPGQCQTACDALADAGDIIQYDVYMLTDSRTNEFGMADGGFGADEGKVWSAYNSITTSRQAANYEIPVLPDLETSETDTGFNPSPSVVPTSAQIQALAWNYIVGGARGYVWFPTCICDDIGKLSFDTINDTTNWPTVHAAVKTVDTQVLALAYVINSQFAQNYVTATGAVNTMAKWVPSENAFYVFVTPKQAASQNVTFTFAGSPVGTVTGVGPSNGSTWSLSGGQITVSFADANDAHVFKVPNN